MKINLILAVAGLALCLNGVRADAQTTSSDGNFAAALSVPAAKIVVQAKKAAVKRQEAAKAASPKGPGYIGIVLSQTANDPTIMATIYGMPAERAGLRYGDVISKINDTPTLGLKAKGIASLLSGASGSSVRITVLRATPGKSGSPILREFTIVREPQPEGVTDWDILGTFIAFVNGSANKDYVFEVLEPGGPADIAGLRRKDQLVSVDGHPTHGITIDELYRRLRGPAGSQVKVRISRQGSAGGPRIEREFTITRDELSAPIAIDKGNMAPDFSLMTDDGRQVSLSQLKGKVVLLDFSTTWCIICQVNEPLMVGRYKKYAARGLVILRIDSGEKRQLVVDYDKAHHLPYPTLLDENRKASTAYMVSGFPTLFLIGPQGQVLERHVGDPDSSVAGTLETEIEAALH